MTRLVLILGLCCCGLVLPAIAQNEGLPANKVAELVSLISTKVPDSQTMKNAGQVGRLLLAEQRYPEAAQLFTAVLQREPGNSAALYGAALALFNTGKTKEAEPLARAAVATTSPAGGDWSKVSPELRQQHTEALVLLAVVVAVRGDDQESLELAKSAARIAPENFDAQLTLGRALVSAGDHRRAVVAFRAAVSLKPNDGRALFFLGTTLEQAGDLQAANTVFRQLIASQPTAAEGHMGLGSVLVKMGEVGEGLKELEKALEIQPDLYEAQVTLGRSLIAQGRPADSLKHLQRAAELAPGNPEPHYQLSLAYRRLGRNDKAAEESEMVRRIHESRRLGAAPVSSQKQPE